MHNTLLTRATVHFERNNNNDNYLLIALCFPRVMNMSKFFEQCQYQHIVKMTGNKEIEKNDQ